MALANLVEASNAVDELGGTLLLEVLNPVENPDYPLNSTGDALGVRHRALEAGAARVELLIDLYHFARIGQPPAYVLAEAAGAMGHVQVADAPGRNEPGSGTLGVDGLFRPLAEAGWDGWVGLEYRPRTGTKDSLAWLGTEKRRRRPTRCA